jgi:hypothetical protein
MTRRLTVAERHASAAKDFLLEEIAERSVWDQFLVEQAVLHVGIRHDEFSANDLRDLLPELGHGYLGAAINSLRNDRLIEHTGRVLPSTLDSTHGHRIAVWRLTGKAHAIAAQRKAARREQAA